MRKLVVLVALLSGLGLAQNGWINPYTGGIWNNPGSCLLDTMIRNRMNQQMLEKSIARRPNQVTPPTAPRLPRVTYRSAENLGTAEQLAASLTTNPQDRQQLSAAFLDGLDKYRAAAAQVGRANDVGYALAFCLGCNYSVANQCDVPDDQLMALARQMDAALADMPGFRQTSDAQRQTLAESLAMMGMYVAAGYEQSHNNPRARDAFIELAQTSFRSLTGLEARRVILTPAGMRTR